MIAWARERCALCFRLRNLRRTFGVRQCLKTRGASRVSEGAQTPQESFPRSGEPPQQSPKHWVKEKDRYLRQLLIRDIEAVTKRPLVVFFSQLDQRINHTDPDGSFRNSPWHQGERGRLVYSDSGRQRRCDRKNHFNSATTAHFISSDCSKLGKIRSHEHSAFSEQDRIRRELGAWAYCSSIPNQ